MNKSETIGKLSESLAKAQGTMKPAVMNKENPFFKSKYADLQSVWDAIRDPFSKNGLSVIQTTEVVDSGTIVNTTILHSSGEWISSALKLNPTQNTPQGVGSALTYARRYALSAIAGVCADEDDDANAAEGKDFPKTPPVVSAAASKKENARPKAEAKKDDGHDHSWRPSKFPDKLTGDELEYCVACKATRTKIDPNEQELPF
jgi:hypothetical protein